MIKEKIGNIKKDIGDAQLVAVTKRHSVEKIKKAIKAGVTTIGENRIQEALEKHRKLKDYLKKEGVGFHFIGHLQRNKAKDAVAVSDMIQSLDSLKLAKKIDKEARKISKTQDVLIQVNIGREEQKYGIIPEELLKFIHEIKDLKNIRIRGLMCIPPYFEDPEKTRPYFKKMKLLYDEIRGFKGTRPIIEKNKKDFNTLSMGMSNDYKIAVEEGTTMVRIGTAIFGERKY